MAGNAELAEQPKAHVINERTENSPENPANNNTENGLRDAFKKPEDNGVAPELKSSIDNYWSKNGSERKMAEAMGKLYDANPAGAESEIDKGRKYAESGIGIGTHAIPYGHAKMLFGLVKELSDGKGMDHGWQRWDEMQKLGAEAQKEDLSTSQGMRNAVEKLATAYAADSKPYGLGERVLNDFAGAGSQMLADIGIPSAKRALEAKDDAKAVVAIMKEQGVDVKTAYDTNWQVNDRMRIAKNSINDKGGTEESRINQAAYFVEQALRDSKAATMRHIAGGGHIPLLENEKGSPLYQAFQIALKKQEARK